MVIINTNPLAAIIHAVSAGSIFDTGACASAGEAAATMLKAAATMTSVRLNLLAGFIASPLKAVFLKCVHVGFAGPYSDGLLDRGNEDFPVADLSGLGGFLDGLDHLVDLIGRHRNLDADLGQEIHSVFGAAIYFGVALLATVALDLARGHSVHADGNQLVAHLVELERLDDGDDQFHDFIPDKLWPAPRRRKVPRRRGPAQYQKLGRIPPRRGGIYRRCRRRPSWQTEATSAPSRAKTRPREKPREPERLGLSWA